MTFGWLLLFCLDVEDHFAHPIKTQLRSASLQGSVCEHSTERSVLLGFLWRRMRHRRNELSGLTPRGERFCFSSSRIDSETNAKTAYVSSLGGGLSPLAVRSAFEPKAAPPTPRSFTEKFATEDAFSLRRFARSPW